MLLLYNILMLQKFNKNKMNESKKFPKWLKITFGAVPVLLIVGVVVFGGDIIGGQGFMKKKAPIVKEGVQSQSLLKKDPILQKETTESSENVQSLGLLKKEPIPQKETTQSNENVQSQGLLNKEPILVDTNTIGKPVITNPFNGISGFMIGGDITTPFAIDFTIPKNTKRYATLAKLGGSTFYSPISNGELVSPDDSDGWVVLENVTQDPLSLSFNVSDEYFPKVSTDTKAYRHNFKIIACDSGRYLDLDLFKISLEELSLPVGCKASDDFYVDNIRQIVCSMDYQLVNQRHSICIPDTNGTQGQHSLKDCWIDGEIYNQFYCENLVWTTCNSVNVDTLSSDSTKLCTNYLNTPDNLGRFGNAWSWYSCSPEYLNYKSSDLFGEKYKCNGVTWELNNGN